MDWLKRLMAGRYGTDQLNLALVVLSLLLSLIAQLANLPWLAFLVYVLLAIALYRMLSRNTARRGLENYRFFMLIGPLYARFQQVKNAVRERRTHRYYRCPNCRARLRVPKGKGKIIITCAKCKTKFAKKT